MLYLESHLTHKKQEKNISLLFCHHLPSRLHIHGYVRVSFVERVIHAQDWLIIEKELL